MKIIIIGATGTICSEVVKALLLNKHEVVRASRNGEVKVNLDDPASIRALFDKIQGVDAVVSCAGNAAFKPFAELTDADYELGIRSKLMGQVSLARIAKDHLRERGSITLTTGVLAMHPMPGSASISMVNAGLEGFVRAIAHTPEPRLGSCWAEAISYYYDKEGLDHLTPTDDWYPASIFFQGMKFMVFGDPSLLLPANR